MRKVKEYEEIKEMVKVTSLWPCTKKNRTEGNR